MHSNLKKIVKDKATKRKIYWSGTRDNKIWKIEKDFNEGKIQIDDVMDALQREFSYHIKSDDYREIRTHLERL